MNETHRSIHRSLKLIEELSSIFTPTVNIVAKKFVGYTFEFLGQELEVDVVKNKFFYTDNRSSIDIPFTEVGKYSIYGQGTLHSVDSLLIYTVGGTRLSIQLDEYGD